MQYKRLQGLLNRCQPQERVKAIKMVEGRGPVDIKLNTLRVVNLVERLIRPDVRQAESESLAERCLFFDLDVHKRHRV